MATLTITGCTIGDSAAISRNNMSAFWQNPTWVLSWKHTTLEKHIETNAKRYPRTLINNRESARHQKAVDENGQLVGYCRWILPPSHANFETWPEAITPAVSQEEEAEIRRVAANVVFDPNMESDELDVLAGKIKDEIMSKKPYLYLDYLAVHPDNQGRGIASALVESGIKQAKSLNVPIFVHACKPGKGVYERAGFRIEQELIRKYTAPAQSFDLTMTLAVVHDKEKKNADTLYSKRGCFQVGRRGGICHILYDL